HHISIAVDGSDASFDLEIRKRHLSYPEGIARHGRHIIGTLSNGTVPAGGPIRIAYRNTVAPQVAETDHVWLRVKGRAPEITLALEVLPGPAEYLRVIVPSGVKVGQEFEVLIVSLDRFDNCSSTRYEGDSLLLTTGKNIARDLDFAGSTRVPITIRAAGTYRFKFRDTISNAVRVGPDYGGPYWGDIHLHTKLSHDGYGTDPYGYARDVSGLDFAAVTDHVQSLGPEGYQQVRQWARDADEPGKFVTLLADERNPKSFTGHHNLYLRDEEHYQACASLPDNTAFADPDKVGHLQALLDPGFAMLVPHHTGLSWRGILPGEDKSEVIDLDACDDAGLRPVMEIYSHHGQSESWDPQHILSYEFNRMRRDERRSNASVSGPYYAQDYWMAGRKLGVIGSSDEHSGQPGRCHGGLAAVWAPELSREAIFDALRDRRCYATTGERILIDFSVAGVDMGGTGQSKRGEAVAISLGVWATANLLRVEILRYRFDADRRFEAIYSAYPIPESTDLSVSLEETCSGKCMYYARIVQEPLDWPGMAWTSPVWINVE
ncbi:MAG: DUF3604 domain-containing protein, partial [Fidelibacterota bacterium]